MLKKITAALLAVFIMISGAELFTYADEVPQPIDEYKLDLLRAVGIIRSGAQCSGGVLTRLEGAEAVLAMLNIEPAFTGAQSRYSDITDNTYESAVTSAAYDYGIMTGIDGRFVPDGVLTFNEAVKIIITAMGYGRLGEKNGGFPSGYIKAARDAGLLKNVEPGSDEGILQDKFYTMIYNAALIPVLQPYYLSENVWHYTTDSNETFLDKYHDIHYISGKITANGVTGLYGGAVAGKSVIKINSDFYEEGSSNASRYIGCMVDAFYSGKDSAATLIWAHPTKKCNSELIYSYQMQPYKKSDGKIKADFGNKSSRIYRISEVADFIYNGRYIENPSEFQLNIKNGYIELIDNDNDKTYDCLKIHDYVTYRVRSIDRENKTVFDRFGQPPIKFADDGIDVSITKNGLISDFEEISAGDVLLVAADETELKDGYISIKESAKIFEIMIADESISGKAESITMNKDERRVRINDAEYEFSEELYMLMNDGKKALLRQGVNYKFIIGENGAIIDAEPADDEMFGFLTKSCYNSDDGVYSIQYFDFSSRQVIKKKLAKRVSLNGRSSGFKEVEEAFRTDSTLAVKNEIVPQLFIYRENFDGEISYIDTWIYNDGAEDAQKSLRLSVKGGAFSTKSGKYHMSHRFVMGENAKVLTVRQEKRNGTASIKNDTSSFTLSDRNNVSDYWLSYNVEAYNCNTAGVTDMLVIYKTTDYDLTEETEISGGMMFSSFSEIMYDGEACTQLNGYSPNGPVTLVLDSEISAGDWKGSSFEKISVSDLKKGDIIKYQTDNSKCFKIERIFSYERSESFYSEYHYYRSFMDVTQSHFAYGKAFAYQDGVMRVKFDKDFSVDNQNSYAVIEAYDKDVLVFDTESEEFEILSPDGILCADNTGDFETAYDIVFHTHDLRLDAIYAFK